MHLAQRISDLEAEVDTLTKERDAAVARAEKAETERDAALEHNGELIELLENADGENEKLRQEVEALKSPGEATEEELETQVRAEVNKRLASAGVPPVERVDTPSGGDLEGGEPGGKGRTRSTWSREF